MDRTELESAIEREVHKLMSRVSEHVYDFVNLYVRRNNIPLDYEQMKKLLEIVKIGMQDGELKHIENFHQGIKKELNSILNDSETPFTNAPEQQVKQTEEKISFSL